MHCCRIQPLNEKISSVTQVKCEELKSEPDCTSSLRIATEKHGASSEVSRKQSESTDPTQVTPGGLFAGVGEFPPTDKEKATSKTELAIKYRADAMLRYVDEFYIWLQGELLICTNSGFQRFLSISTHLVQHQLKSPIITWTSVTA